MPEKYHLFITIAILLQQFICASGGFSKFTDAILKGYRTLNNRTTMHIFFINEENVYPYNDSLYDSSLYQNRYYKYESKYNSLYNGSPFILRYDLSHSINPIKKLNSIFYLSVTDRPYVKKLTQLPYNLNWTLTWNLSTAYNLKARYSRSKNPECPTGFSTFKDDYRKDIDLDATMQSQIAENSRYVIDFVKSYYEYNQESIFLGLSHSSIQGTGRLVPSVSISYSWREQLYIYIDDVFFDTYQQNSFHKTFLLRDRPRLTVHSAIDLNLSSRFTVRTRFNFVPEGSDSRNSMFQQYDLGWNGTWRLGRQSAYFGYSRKVYNYQWDNPYRTETFKSSEIENALKITELVQRNKNTRERTVDQFYIGISIQ